MNTASSAPVPQAPVKRPYRILGMVAATHSVTHMFTALMPIIFTYIMAEFGISYTQLGLMMGVGQTSGGILQGVYGFLSRRVSRRVLLGAGNITIAVSMALMPLTAGYTPFFITYMMAQLGGSPQHPVGSSLLAEGFGRKLRGTAFALNIAGGNAGTLLVPSLGTIAVVALGWRSALYIFAILPLLTGLMSIAFIPKDPEHAPVKHAGSIWQGVASGMKSLASPFKERNITLLIVASVIVAGSRGMGMIMTYVPLYLKQGLNLPVAPYATLFTLLMAGSIVGPLIGGRISDSLGRKTMLVSVLILSALATVAMLLVGSRTVPLAIILVTMGMVVFAIASLMQAFVADLVKKELRDITYSTYYSLNHLGGAIWAVIMGAAIDFWGFSGGFTIMAVSYIVTMLIILPIKSGRGGAFTRNKA